MRSALHREGEWWQPDRNGKGRRETGKQIGRHRAVPGQPPPRVRVVHACGPRIPPHKACGAQCGPPPAQRRACCRPKQVLRLPVFSGPTLLLCTPTVVQGDSVHSPWDRFHSRFVGVLSATDVLGFAQSVVSAEATGVGVCDGPTFL